MKRLLFLVFSLFTVGNLEAQTKIPCTGSSYDIVKPYLGVWQEYRVTDSAEVYLGLLETKLDVKGCAITQRFTQADSSFTYLSFGYVNPSSNLWEETYVFSTGGTSKFQWVIEDGTVYTRRIGGSRSIDHIYRLKYTDVVNNEYSVIPQKSFDGGKTWENTGRTRIKKSS